MKNTLFTALLYLLLGNCSFSQEIVAVHQQPCDKSVNTDYLHENRLISRELIQDTLYLTIGLVRQCSFDGQISMTYQHDSLVLEIADIAELYTPCYCYFEIDLKINGISDTNFTTYYQHHLTGFSNVGLFESIEILELKQFSTPYIFPTLAEINGNSVLNQYTKDGVKIGLWLSYDPETNNLKQKTFYELDDHGKSSVKWAVTYTVIGSIDKICVPNGAEDLGTISYCIDYKSYQELMNVKL